MIKFFGTHWKKLVRRNAVETSVVAAKDLDTSKMEQIVLDCVAKFGEVGCTQDQVLDQLREFSYSSVTARFSSLMRKGYIIDTGERREGKSGRQQRVIKAT